MKNYVYYIVIAFCFCTQSAFAGIECYQDSSSILVNDDPLHEFIVEGEIAGIPDGSRLSLRYKIEREMTVYTTIVKNGSFSFKGRISEPTMASITLTPDWTDDGGLFYNNFILEKGKTVITGTSLVNAEIIGGPIQEQYNRSRLQHLKLWYDSVLVRVFSNEIRKKKPDTVLRSALNPVLAERRRIYTEARLAFIMANNDSYIALVKLRELASNPNFDAEPLFETLTDRLKNLRAGKQLAAFISSSKQLKIGSIAPDFIQRDTTGNNISLYSLRGKYVLVEFWASWCKPCRVESPSLIKAYNEFKTEGFEILGVSLDDQKKMWTQAIRDDGLPWIQVSDLLRDNSAAKAFGVSGVPNNFLLDPRGVIVAFNLRGESLAKKLQDIMGASAKKKGEKTWKN